MYIYSAPSNPDLRYDSDQGANVSSIFFNQKGNLRRYFFPVFSSGMFKSWIIELDSYTCLLM